MFKARVDAKWRDTWDLWEAPPPPPTEAGCLSPRSAEGQAAPVLGGRGRESKAFPNATRVAVCKPFGALPDGPGPDAALRECTTCFGLALWELYQDAEITSLSFPGENLAKPIAEALKAVVVQLQKHKHIKDASEANKQLGSSLKKLAESLLAAACKLFFKDGTWERHLKHNFPECWEDCIEARLFRVFSLTAEKFAPKSKADFNLLSCCSLVYACKWFVEMMMKESEKSEDVHFIIPPKPNSEADFDKFMESLDENRAVASAKMMPASGGPSIGPMQTSSFLVMVEKEWAGAKAHLAEPENPILLCTSVEKRLEDEKQAFEAMEKLCVGYALSPSEDFDPADERFPELFKDTVDRLGRAAFEFPCREQGFPEVARELEGSIQVLFQCIKKGRKWESSRQLENLSLHGRLVTEALVKAAWDKLCKPKGGKSIKLSNQADDLKKADQPSAAQQLGALCKAGHHLCCDGGLHLYRGKNLGNCTIFYCRAITFAIMTFVKLMDLQCLKDANKDDGKHFTKFLQDLDSETKDATNALAYFNDSFKLAFQTLDHEHRLARTGREEFLRNFHWHVKMSVMPELAKCANTELSQLSQNWVLKEMEEILKRFECAAEAVDSGSWLLRVLNKQDDKHYTSILEKLRRLFTGLQDMQRKLRWLGYEDSLQELERMISAKEKEYSEYLARVEKLRNDVLDDRGHLQGLRGRGDLTESDQLELADEELAQAVAFAQATLDEETGTYHRYIDHPDMKVLWYRVKELRQSSQAKWRTFIRRAFPSQLAISDSLLEELEDLLRSKKARQDLKQSLALSCSPDDENAVFSAEDVNRVFVWGELKRVGLLEAIRHCQADAQLGASSDAEGPGTPQQQPEPQDARQSEADGPGKPQPHPQPQDARQDDAGPPLLGRNSDLWKAIQVLLRKERKHHLFLQGPAGIGKSALCDAVRARWEEQMQTGFQKVDMFGASTADGVNAALFSGLGITGMGEDGDTAAARVSRRLQAIINQRVPSCPAQATSFLLILDTCEIPLETEDASNALAAILDHVSNNVPSVSIVMAARPGCLRESAESNIRNLFVEHHLTGLNLDDAMTILRQGYGHPVQDGNVQPLAEQCKGIPLLLTLAAGILNHGRAGFETIRIALAAANNCVGTALLKWHPEHHLALLKLSPFPLSFSTKQAKFMLDDDDAILILQELYSRRLVLAQPSPSYEKLWGLHASVRDALWNLGMASPNQAAAHDWQQHTASASIRFAQCMTAELAKCASAPPPEAARIAQAQQANLFAALSPARKDARMCTAVTCELLREWALFSRKGWVKDVGKVAGLLLPSLEQLCQAVARLVDMEEGNQDGGEGAPVPRSVSLEGVADEGLQRVFQDHLSPIPPLKHLLLLQDDYCSLHASVLANSGMYDEEEQMRQQVLELRRKVLGPKHLGTLSAMHNLAGSLSKQGKGGEAAAKQQKVMEALHKMHGDEHPDTLASKHNLAIIWGDQGKHREAAAMQREVLEVRRKVLGPKHQDTLATKNDLACSLGMLGNHEEAAAMQREVLEVRRKVLGPEHQDTLTGMNTLATSLYRQGKHEEAAARQEEVLEAQREVLSDKHPDILISMNNQGARLGKQGKHEEAVVIQQQVLEMRRKVLSDGHPDTALARHNLQVGLFNWSVQRRNLPVAQVDAFLRSALTTMEWPVNKELPESWSVIVHAWCKLLAASGAKGKALALAKQAHDQCHSQLGGSDADTKACKKLCDRYAKK